MKKILLSLAVVFVMSSFTTSNTDVEKVVLEEVGPASDCVQSSKEKAEWAAAVNGGDPMDYYMAYYIDCFYSIQPE
jgi:hypothetical protein